MKLPAASPDLNSYAERFVLSIKSECLNRVIAMGKDHLRDLVGEYVHHYHEERNHQGLDNELITPLRKDFDQKSKIKCQSRLGGILNYYLNLARKG